MPEFAKPLAAYIRPRAETLAIRQQLARYIKTRYLKNVTGDADGGELFSNPKRDDAVVGHFALWLAVIRSPSLARLEGKNTTTSMGASPTDKMPPSPTEEFLENSDGLRGRYVRALRANSAAKNAYDEAAQELESLRANSNNNSTTTTTTRTEQPMNTYGGVITKTSQAASRSSRADKSSGGSSNLQTYLTLLRYRRGKSKLSILQEFAEKLAAMKDLPGNDEETMTTTSGVAGNGFTDQYPGNGNDAVGSVIGAEIVKRSQMIRDLRGEIDLRKQSQSWARNDKVYTPQENEGVNTGRQKISVDSRVEMLEKAVLRAKLEARKEAKAIEVLRRKYEGGLSKSNPTTRLLALSRTRDTLVRWVEETLASLGTGGDDAQESDESDFTVHDLSNLNDRQARISKTYDAYVEARRNFIDVVAECSKWVQSDKEKPVSDSSLSPSSSTSSSPQRSQPQPSSTTSAISALQAILPHIYNHISTCLTPSSLTASLPEAQASHLTNITAKESSTVFRILDRLAVESQLLHEHPPIGESTATRSPGAPLAAPFGSNPGNTQINIDLTSRARMWCLAAQQANAATERSVGTNSEKGQAAVKEAEKMVREVYEIMGQDYEAVVDGDAGCEKEVAELGVTRLSQGVKSPWARLDGGVGVI